MKVREENKSVHVDRGREKIALVEEESGNIMNYSNIVLFIALFLSCAIIMYCADSYQ